MENNVNVLPDGFLKMEIVPKNTNEINTRDNQP